MRGFDIFMKVARRIYEVYPDVLFVVVGADQTYYGGDERHVQHATFKEHVLNQEEYDLSRFCFTGQIPDKQLVEIRSLSDLHIYLSIVCAVMVVVQRVVVRMCGAGIGYATCTRVG